MNGNKRHIITWITMICFMAGQYMVYAHQHKVLAGKIYSKLHKRNISEKCELCDAMHHNAKVISQHSHAPLLAEKDVCYTNIIYHLTSIGLILSAGRSPPLS